MPALPEQKWIWLLWVILWLKDNCKLPASLQFCIYTSKSDSLFALNIDLLAINMATTMPLESLKNLNLLIVLEVMTTKKSPLI